MRSRYAALGRPGLLTARFTLLVAVSLLSGCAASVGNPPPTTGAGPSSFGQNSTVTQKTKRPDPGDPAAHPLPTLVADPLFAALPPQSTKTGEKQIPAHNETPVFGSGGSFGAGYSIDFSSTAPPDAVYTDLAKRAAANGWVVEAKDGKGRIVQWAKAYPDGSRAAVHLYAYDQDKTSPPYTYSLDASI